jgi:hypothetical protein
MTKKLAISLLVVLSGCSKAHEVTVEHPSATQYDIPGGYVNEFRLSDGTRCVSYNGYKQGGIHCNWTTGAKQ